MPSESHRCRATSPRPNDHECSQDSKQVKQFYCPPIMLNVPNLLENMSWNVVGGRAMSRSPSPFRCVSANGDPLAIVSERHGIGDLHAEKCSYAGDGSRMPVQEPSGFQALPQTIDSMTQLGRYFARSVSKAPQRRFPALILCAGKRVSRRWVVDQFQALTSCWNFLCGPGSPETPARGCQNYQHPSLPSP